MTQTREITSPAQPAENVVSLYLGPHLDAAHLLERLQQISFDRIDHVRELDPTGGDIDRARRRLEALPSDNELVRWLRVVRAARIARVESE